MGEANFSGKDTCPASFILRLLTRLTAAILIKYYKFLFNVNF